MKQPMGAYERVKAARAESRPRAKEFIEALLTDVVYLKGDRRFGDSRSVLGGIASYGKIPVTFIGIQKGRGLEEGILTDFGMPKPEGYRKALRLMEQAEKFQRPVLTFVDTPGAYPGVDAEERGQAEAIAALLSRMSCLEVPVLAFLIGEGGSGGALALSVANRLYMLENAVFSILSPEGFASILWKDSSLAAEAAELMKLTAGDLKRAGIVDEVIPEEEFEEVPGLAGIRAVLDANLETLASKKGKALKKERQEKFRKIGR